MDLVIDKSNQINGGFIQFIIDVIRSKLMINILKYQNYDILFDQFDQDITSKEVISQAASNIISYNYFGRIVIMINNTVNYNKSTIKLIDLCRILNYGTLDKNGCHIFSKTFDYISNNLNELYDEYNLRS